MISKIFRLTKILITNIIDLFIIYMPDPLGHKIRYLFYKKRFKKCGKNVKIDIGVVIENPEYISIGDNVWIGMYSNLVAGSRSLESKVVKYIENKISECKIGDLIIGNGVHIGAYNILQAHSGILIGNKVTTSAGVKIYSLSNYPYNELKKDDITYASCMVEKEDKVSYISSPIVIKDGVWIALDCLVLGGTIGKYSFITSKSVIYKDIPENSYVSGNPAKRIKERFKIGQSYE